MIKRPNLRIPRVEEGAEIQTIGTDPTQWLWETLTPHYH
jgi:hypothetical protein